jgi:hypothetical protein
MTEDMSKWRDVVEKLMRKAEDPATLQFERDSITDKITYLMTKYGIEQDMLRAAEHRPIVAEMRRFVIHPPYASKKASLLNAISKAFGCFAVTTRDGKMSVFGTEDDIERVFMLNCSLVIQMSSAMAGAEKPLHVHGKAFNNSFVNGYVLTVINRIREAAARAKADVKATTTGNGMELVLVDKARVVTNRVTQEFPRLSYSRTSYSSSNGAGYAAGQAAGMRADLGGTRISNSARREIGS